MASTTKVDQAARAKARERRIALDTDRAARDARIEDAAALVFSAVAAKVSAEREMATIVDRIAAGLHRLRDEGLTTEQAARLCDLPLNAAQKLVRHRRATDTPAARQMGRNAESPSAARPTSSDESRPVMRGGVHHG